MYPVYLTVLLLGVHTSAYEAHNSGQVPRVCDAVPAADERCAVAVARPGSQAWCQPSQSATALFETALLGNERERLLLDSTGDTMARRSKVGGAAGGMGMSLMGGGSGCVLPPC